VKRKLRIIVNAIPAAVPVTGIGRYVLELYAAIQALAGDELEIAYYDGRGLSPRPPKAPADVRGLSLAAKVYWSLPGALALPIRLGQHGLRERRFARLSRGADIYHEAAYFPFRPAPGVRIVQTVQDLSLQFHPEWHPAERVAFSRRHFGDRLRWASRILCISAFTREELVRFDPGVAGRIAVTPLGVSPAFRPAGVDERRRVRARYGLPPEYLLFVGSGDPRKNTRLLGELAAGGRLPCPVVCVGWGGWLAPGSHGRVLNLGYVPNADLPALYSEAAAFVFPSLYEGFGLPVLEAMACGCPVVVPRAHSMPELVGDAGLYYGDPADADGLAACLATIAGDAAVRRALSEAGIRRAGLFDWERTARLTLAAFEESLASPPGTG
jgi:alpha-1,3-rhamnosyl/mannosyltransferase